MSVETSRLKRYEQRNAVGSRGYTEVVAMLTRGWQYRMRARDIIDEELTL
jgi:hypothetical protein